MEDNNIPQTLHKEEPSPDTRTPASPTRAHMSPSYISQRIVIVLALIIGALFLFNVINNFKLDKKYSQKIAPTPQTTTSPLSTASWKTYSGTDSHGNSFTLKYPKDWIFQDAKDVKEYSLSGNKGSTIIFGDSLDKNHLGEKVQVYPALGFVLNNYQQNKLSNDLEDHIKNYSMVYKKNYITIDGIKALEIYYRGSASGDSLITVLNKDTLTFEISIPNSASNYLEKYKQILSTFKFTTKDNSEIKIYPSNDPSKCSETDTTFCQYFFKIQGLLNIKDYKALIDEQILDPNPVTCKKPDDPQNFYVCKDHPQGAKVQGFAIFRNDSEEGVFPPKYLLEEYQKHFSSSDIFLYQGYKVRNDKAIVVFLNKKQTELFVLRLEKINNKWQIFAIMNGVATKDLIELNKEVDTLLN